MSEYQPAMFRTQLQYNAYQLPISSYCANTNSNQLDYRFPDSNNHQNIHLPTTRSRTVSNPVGYSSEASYLAVDDATFPKDQVIHGSEELSGRSCNLSRTFVDPSSHVDLNSPMCTGYSAYSQTTPYAGDSSGEFRRDILSSTSTAQHENELPSSNYLGGTSVQENAFRKLSSLNCYSNGISTDMTKGCTYGTGSSDRSWNVGEGGSRTKDFAVGIPARIIPNAIDATNTHCSSHQPTGSTGDEAITFLNKQNTLGRGLSQTSPEAKPPYSYVAMISFAIKDSNQGKLTLNGIYQYIVDHFPYFKEVSAFIAYIHNI